MTTISAPAPASAPRSFALARHSASLAVRSLIKTWRTPEALIDVTIQPAIFLILFVYIFGGAVAASTHTYLQFLLPGILGQSITTGAVAIGVNLNTDISKGVFDRFRAFPIPRLAPLLGAVLGDIVRYAVLTVSTLAVGYAMGFRIETDPLRATAGCLLAILFALCLSWLSVVIGLLVRTPGAVQGILFPIMLPLAFASNVFVNPATLPGWMQAFVKVNPLTHLVGAVRGLFLGAPLENHVWWTLAWCAAFVVIFMPLALRAYRRKV
ncbi:MAG TPA: ABC transporter permease [Micromonosporaceae bacterium]|jgi:oleandomycin transport system permease protein